MSKALDTLLKKARAALKKKEPPSGDPVRQVILAVLSANAPREKAESALDKLCRAYADLNELRVSLPDELLEVIGVSYPAGLERMTRLTEALHEVFNREHQTEIVSLKSKGKREQLEYLSTLPGLTHAMSTQVFLLAYDGHAIPVDERMLTLLREEGAVEADCDARHAENLLAKAVKSGEAVMHFLALWSYVDQHQPKGWPPRPEVRPPLVATPASAAKKSGESAKAAAKPAEAPIKPEVKPVDFKKTEIKKPDAKKPEAKKPDTKKAETKKPEVKKPLDPSKKPGVKPSAVGVAKSGVKKK